MSTSGKTHRILVIGVGSIGERHLRCFQKTGRVEMAICEIRRDLREKIADQYGVRDAYVDIDAAEKDGFEAAVIAVPAHLHVPLALQLASGNRHLFIEKPLSTSMDGVPVLEKLIADRGRIAALGYIYRNHPSVAAMRSAVRSGRFGDPVQVVAAVGQHFPTYRPAYREIYYRDRATGGGAIQDGLTHTLDLASWFVGPIDAIAADAAHLVLEGVEVEDTVHVLTRHGNVMGCISLNQHQAPNESTITVNCRKGSARFQAHRNRWSWMTEPAGEWTHECHDVPERDALFVRQANAFLDAIEGRSEPVCSLEEGIQMLRVNREILRCVDGRNIFQSVKHSQ